MLSLHSSVDTFIQMWSSRNDIYVGVYNIATSFMNSKEISQAVQQLCK